MLPNTQESLTISETLLQRQRELEEEGISLGQKRFVDRLQKAIKNGTVAEVGAARKLLTLGVEKFQADLEAIVSSSRKDGRQSAALKWMKLVGPAKAAYITLRTALSGAADYQLMTTVGTTIGKRIEDELRFRRLEAEAPQLYTYKLSNFATNHYMHRSRSLDQSIRWAEIDCTDIEMSPQEMTQVGVYLINRLIEITGFFQVEKEVKGNARHPTFHYHLTPTAETAQWLADRNSALSLMSPIYPPMVVQPLAWGHTSPGGYRYALRGRNRLIRGSNKEHKALIAQASMQPVYTALNLIQNTEWCINKKVLTVFRQVLEMGGGRAGLPSQEPLPATPRPPGIPLEGELTDDQKEELRVWKRKEARRRADDLKRSMEALKYHRLKGTAEKYQDESRMYFPHNLDFRGRIYPIPNVISPQGDDVQKALLQFTVGKPLGVSGVKHLAIHGANAWGKMPDGAKVSKMTLDGRVEYIRRFSGAIRQVAQDPIGNSWWMNVDEPWCFLAFCFEWDAAISHDGTGITYISHLPVASDGTCNGLQHFAALLKDDVAAEAVNVVDNLRPNDIYQKVADKVLERLEKEAVDEPLAALWLASGIVGRSLCKRPTMTLAYGAKQFGFKDQLMHHVKSEADWKSRLQAHFTKLDEEGKEELILQPACVYMARLIWESLGDVVVSAQTGMEWFQKYARCVAKGGLSPRWVVPGTGFVAYQNSYKVKIKQVKTVLCGQLYCPAAYLETDELDPVAAANGISPNIIHSLDAAALMLTVNRAADSGVTSFAMIHDSYGTHAADAWLLNRELRHAFFNLYKEDVLGNLAEQFHAQVASLPVPETKTGKKQEPLSIPEAPGVGRLDISRVLQSDYFFC